MRTLIPVMVIMGMLLGAVSAQGQSYYMKENSIFFEVFGSGGELSLNYEKLIEEKFSVRAGFGLTGVAFRQGLAIPFGVSYLAGRQNHYLEIGVGGSYIDFDKDKTDDVMYDLKEDQLVGTGLLGYRFLGDYGYTFRLAFTPALTKDGFEPMGGAIFGYAF